MTPANAFAAAVGLSLLVVGVTPVRAGQQVYVYTVVHPLYGDIGTFTDTIEHDSEMTRISSRLRIAVELLGIIVYRHDLDTTEIMRNGRLILLHSATEKDGKLVEVHGEAQGDLFLVSAPAGSFAAPASTSPCDPWLLTHIGEGTAIYPSTGKISKVRVTGGESETISANGAPVSTRHFTVIGDNREDVWLDARGIPIMFRSVEDGTPIDFVLRGTGVGGGMARVASSGRSVVVPAGNVSK